MDSTATVKDHDEEIGELMEVFPCENKRRSIIKKTKFLQPPDTTINESEAALRPGPSPDLEASSLRLSFSGWRLPNRKFKSWARKMSALHKPTWIKSGIFEAIIASTYKIHKNPSAILALAHKWCPETKSFVFPWGEATITLEDVNVLLGFSVLGSSVFAPLKSSEMEEAVEKLKKRSKESVKQVSWISSFVDDELEHEAFLVLWLSNFVFPDKPGLSISRDVFPIAVRLARGERIALAPAVLASLYRDLGKIHALASTRNVDLRSLFKLVQVWIWERLKSLRPEAKVIPKGKPRIAQWRGLKQRLENVGSFLLDDFVWRPYTKPLKNWNPPRFYNEEAKLVKADDHDDAEFVSFARCLRVSKLVGIGFIEDYYPNRVGMQFGLAQDLSDLVTNDSSNFTEMEAWEDYNRPLDGSRQYIPSRIATVSLTAAKYREWWMKSVSETLKGPTETFNESNTDDHSDDGDDDVSRKVLPLSRILQKSGDGMKKVLTYKRRKRAREDDNESAKDCCQTNEEEVDGNITIAQIIKSTKKCGVVKNTGGKRSRLEVDYNVPGLPQKLASGDEHNSSDPSVASNGVAEKEEDINITIAQIIRSGKKCGNVEDTEGGDAYGGLEVDYNVPGLPQKLASRNEHNSSDPYVISNGVAEKEEDNNITIAHITKSIKKCGNAENTEGGDVSGLPQKLASGDEHNTSDPYVASNGVAEKEEDNNITIAQITKSIEKCGNDNTEGVVDPYGGRAVDYNVSGLPQKLAYGDETAATPETEQRSGENGAKNSPDPSHGVADDKEEEDGAERLKQRKLAIEELASKLALKLEARILKVAEKEKEEDDSERWKQRKLAIEELALKLEARILKVEKTLAKIKQWMIRKNLTKTHVSG